MARKCEISGTGAQVGNKRSKALNQTKRKWNVNLQKATIMVDGKKQSVKVSAKTKKTLKTKEANNK